jgi:hypothetical protein
LRRGLAVAVIWCWPAGGPIGTRCLVKEQSPDRLGFRCFAPL